MTSTLYSTNEAATRLGIDPSRVRRLAERYGIGQKIGPRAWVFTDGDLDRLRSISTGKPGRPKRDSA